MLPDSFKPLADNVWLTPEGGEVRYCGAPVPPPPPLAWWGRLALAGVRAAAAAQNVLLGFLVRLLFPRRRVQAISRALILRTGTIGDMVTALPAMHAIQRCHPEVRLALLTTVVTPAKPSLIVPGAGLFPPGGALIPQVFTFAPRELLQASSRRALRAQLRAWRPDQVWILPQTGESFSGMLRKLLFLALMRLDCAVTGYRLAAPLHPWPRLRGRYSVYRHQVVTALRAAGAGDNDAVDFTLEVPAAAERHAQALLSGVSGRLVAVCPGAKFAFKQWPLESYRELVRRLLADLEPAARIVVIGGAADAALAAAVAEMDRQRIVNVAGRLSLTETRAVLRRCCLFIGNDSGPMHLAAAMGVPSIGIFASHALPGIWEPYGEGHVALRHWLPCSHCFATRECPEGTRACIVNIPVTAILALARERLQAAGARRAEMAATER